MSGGALRHLSCRTTQAAVTRAVLSVLVSASTARSQTADTSFVTSVDKPAHATRHPRMRLDAGHNNAFLTEANMAQAEPFARLMRADGFVVDTSRGRYSDSTLVGV